MQFRGGVAQQLTTIENQQIEKIRSESYETSEEVGFSFLISFGEKESEKYDKETHTKFMKYVKNTHASTVGGEPFTLLDEQTANEENATEILPSRLSHWLKTVPSNPAVIKYKLESIANLLTLSRFPQPNANIAEKARVIESVINRLTNGTQARCFNDCTGPLNGQCLPMKDSSTKKKSFNFGTCQCSPGFSGADCSKPGPMATLPTPPTTPYRATIPH